MEKAIKVKRRGMGQAHCLSARYCQVSLSEMIFGLRSLGASELCSWLISLR